MLEKTYFHNSDQLSLKEKQYNELINSLLSSIYEDNHISKILKHIYTSQGYLKNTINTDINITIPKNFYNFYNEFTSHIYSKLTIENLCCLCVFHSGIKRIGNENLNDPRMLFTLPMSGFQNWVYIYSFENHFKEYDIYLQKIQNILNKEKLDYINDTYSLNLIYTSFLQNIIISTNYQDNDVLYTTKSKILCASYILVLSITYIKNTYTDNKKLNIKIKNILDFFYD